MTVSSELPKEDISQRRINRSVHEVEEHDEDRKHRHWMERGKAVSGWLMIAALIGIAIWCMYVANNTGSSEVRQLNGQIAGGILGIVIGYILSKMS